VALEEWGAHEEGRGEELNCECRKVVGLQVEEAAALEQDCVLKNRKQWQLVSGFYGINDKIPNVSITSSFSRLVENRRSGESVFLWWSFQGSGFNGGFSSSETKTLTVIVNFSG